ncbi:MAG: hypothetical protein ACAH95_09820 [Fimbriimonas sp.]
MKLQAGAPAWVPNPTLVQRSMYKGGSVTVYSTTADRAALMRAVIARGRLYRDEIYYTGKPAEFGLDPALGPFVVLVPERTMFEYCAIWVERGRESKANEPQSASSPHVAF